MPPPLSHTNFLNASVPCIAYRLLQASGPLAGNRNIPYNNPYLLMFCKIIFICERLVHFRALHWALEMRCLGTCKTGWSLLSIDNNLFISSSGSRFKKRKRKEGKKTPPKTPSNQTKKTRKPSL